MTPIDQPSLGATNLHHDPAMAQIQLPNLVMTNIAMEAMALIEIDGLPIENGDCKMFRWENHRSLW